MKPKAKRRTDAQVREARDAAVMKAITDGPAMVRQRLDEAAGLAADRLVRVIKEGIADAAYVGALRLALQAGGALIERQRVEGITEVVVRHADDAPGTLKKVPGDDDE